MQLPLKRILDLTRGYKIILGYNISGKIYSNCTLVLYTQKLSQEVLSGYVDLKASNLKGCE
jgi:hypothetical protein